MPTRRQVIASAGTLCAGGIATAIVSQESRAQVDTVINGLDIPDTSTSNQIQDLTLVVNANYSYSVGEQPSRVILRVEARRPNGEWTQIGALEPSTTPSEQTNSQELTGSLMSLNGFTAGEIRPQDRGESESYDINIRLRLQVYVNRELAGEANAEETATLTATRESVSVTASIGGEGEINVETQT